MPISILNKLKKIKNPYPKLLFLLIIPAFVFLLKPGYYNMHDDMQMIRQLEMEKCLQDGQIPCRWSPDLGYGYGYPLFNFYPPLPYFVGQVFRSLGFSFVNTVKLTAVSQFVFSAFAMYLLAGSLLGPLAGFLSALFYTYAPYHALNIYVRGAMNEAWAAVFFPLIFHFARKIIIAPKLSLKTIFALSLSFTGLLLSHNPMALTFTPFLFLWCLYFLIKQKFPLQKFFYLSLAGLFSLALAAFYTLPVLFETNLVQTDSMFQNYYHFSAHFTSLYQIFISRFWDDGASVWGPNDDMSFQIGYLHWLLPTLLLVYTLFIFRQLKSKQKRTGLLLVSLLTFAGLFSAFMTHQRSVFIWLALPLIQKVQFPWRFLNHSLFFFSLSIGVGLPIFLSRFKTKIRLLVVAVIVALLFGFNYQYFHPLKSGPVTDAQKFAGLAWTNQITSGIYDYLPKTASTAAKGPANPYLDVIIPDTTVKELSGAKKGTDWLFFNLNLDQDSQIVLPVLEFPNFEIKDNGQIINHSFEPELGRITIDLTRGNHQIYLKLRDTPIRTVSNIISLVSWLFLVLCLLKKPCNLPKLKN